MPVLIIIPVKESALRRGGDGAADTAAFHRIRERILEDAWEGLGLREVAKRGSSFRVALVGLHEFESRSKAAAATAENLVFAGGLEEASSEDVATKLAELAGRTRLIAVSSTNFGFQFPECLLVPCSCPS